MGVLQVGIPDCRTYGRFQRFFLLASGLQHVHDLPSLGFGRWRLSRSTVVGLSSLGLSYWRGEDCLGLSHVDYLVEFDFLGGSLPINSVQPTAARCAVSGG